LLNYYRNDHLCFNDDIQGTGATTLAGVLGALRAQGKSVLQLAEQRIAIVGAGSAGIGVAQVLLQAMMEHGVSMDEAKECFFVLDANGLLDQNQSYLTHEQRMFARDIDGGMKLDQVVRKYKPTMLLGMTGIGGIFNEEIIREMAKHCARPVIFPLSNPTIKAECTATQAFTWTDGRCIFASGSPFDPVTLQDGRVYNTSQCNNMYIFPGLGLGATLCGAERITDKMLYLAAETLANQVSREELSQGKVFPHISKIREVSKNIAMTVIGEAQRDGQATKLRGKYIEDMEAYVESKMYDPVYVPLVEKRRDFT
jgi:malate dehydrogenase (oxaloacetate-decarboxylating)(NADP+)